MVDKSSDNVVKCKVVLLGESGKKVIILFGIIENSTITIYAYTH